MDPADRLYTLPLEEFTAARNELAKQLRKDGERERADEVKALRKPSQAAWALNYAARAEPGAVGELLHAGKRLRRVQEDVLAGSGDRDDLRAAVEAEREAVASLLAEAEALLGSPTEQVRNRIRDTLHAAAGDEEVAALLKAGRLAEDHKAVGLGPFGAMAPAASPRKAPKKAAEKAPKKSKAKAAKGKAKPQDEKAAQKERERKTRAREIQKQLTRVERDAEKAARELSAAEHDRERAEMSFKSALRAHEEARAKAEARKEEAAKLRAELEGMREP